MDIYVVSPNVNRLVCMPSRFNKLADLKKHKCGNIRINITPLYIRSNFNTDNMFERFDECIHNKRCFML